MPPSAGLTKSARLPVSSVNFPRVLFILKLRQDYGCAPYGGGDGLSSGLFNSARMVVEMLGRAGVPVKLVQVVDNNDIDRDVSIFRPDIVVIEGLWVVPEKFRVLIPLHPKVRWTVRIHSEIPFLAMEGIAMDWIAKYVYSGVLVGCNSQRNYNDIREYTASVGNGFDRRMLGFRSLDRPVLYLPNYYPVGRPWWNPRDHDRSDPFRVGCFGAIRPLKNQLIQAMAAIEFAARIRRRLRFYVTMRDCEQGGDQVLKNLRALFAHTGNELVERPWLAHDEFLGILDLVDVGMACSLSESFCIVAADMVNAGVPVVVSPEIQWASFLSRANPTNTESMARAISFVTSPFTGEISRQRNRVGLAESSERARQAWLAFLRDAE